jgi:hypothetical protein
MNMMLYAVFAAVAFGLFGRRFQSREMRIVVIVATTLTVAYFIRPTLMT